jgi:hypothetical protein
MSIPAMMTLMTLDILIPDTPVTQTVPATQMVPAAQTVPATQTVRATEIQVGSKRKREEDKVEYDTIMLRRVNPRRCSVDSDYDNEYAYGTFSDDESDLEFDPNNDVYDIYPDSFMFE